jgi:hypothetical protein
MVTRRRKRNAAAGGKLIPAKVRVSKDGTVRVFVNPKHLRRSNPQQAFNVYIGTKKIDTVFYDSDMSAADVKRSLVNHDGYDSRIKVVKAKKPK